jgi:hypothetical protein
MIERGICSTVLAHVMGRRDATTTERTYIHLFSRQRTDDQVRQAMQSAMSRCRVKVSRPIVGPCACSEGSGGLFRDLFVLLRACSTDSDTTDKPAFLEKRNGSLEEDQPVEVQSVERLERLQVSLLSESSTRFAKEA